MPVKAVNPRLQINELGKKLEETRERREEIYYAYNEAKSEKKRQKYRDKCRPLDLLLDTFFYQLWSAYLKLPNDLEEIDRYKGFDNKARIVYCDGEHHLVTGKKKYKYGFFCNCD